MIDIKKLQKEAKEWEAKNFPQSDIPDMFMGIIEELGELARVYVKRKHGIRLNDNPEEKIKDAIGDTFIFLTQLSSKLEYDIEDIINETWNEVKQRDWKKYPQNGMTE